MATIACAKCVRCAWCGAACRRRLGPCLGVAQGNSRTRRRDAAAVSGPRDEETQAMEHEDFDRRTRLLAESDGTRRTIIRLVAGSAFGVVAARLGLAKTEAKKGKGGKGNTKGKGKKKCTSKGKTTICHNGQTLSIPTCALKTHPGATIGACTTATVPLPVCAGKNSCQVTAACNKQGYPTCQCHVAVGSGTPHCGQIPLVHDCTATSGCAVDEVCVDLTGCVPPEFAQTGCSAPCQQPQ